MGIDYFATVVAADGPPGVEQVQQSIPHWQRLPRLRELYFINKGIMLNQDPLVREIKRALPDVKVVIACSDAHIMPAPPEWTDTP